VKETWQLVEQHGVWWAYQGELPPPEAFQTHGRTAEALMGRQLAQTRFRFPPIGR
jgi:hypothetical protein